MNSEKVKKQQERCRTEWFKNHKARKELELNHNLIIDWSNPESWNYGCRFIIHRRWLTVVGDIGEAVYEWGQDLSLNFLARIDLGYFLGKCQASEDGRKFHLWDSEEAISSINYYLTEYPDEGPLQDGLKHILSQVDKHANKYDFEEALRSVYNDYAVDSDVISAIRDSGEQPHPRAIGHFVGLQMAIEQLQPHATTP